MGGPVVWVLVCSIIGLLIMPVGSSDIVPYRVSNSNGSLSGAKTVRKRMETII